MFLSPGRVRRALCSWVVVVAAHGGHWSQSRVRRLLVGLMWAGLMAKKKKKILVHTEKLIK